MLDPERVAQIAQMDQLQAAFGTWADCLVAGWRELVKRGVPTETALDTAREWLALIIASIAASDV